MVYEAVPIDVELQKVTAQERDALSRYKIHENINTFLGNEGTPKLIATGALLASLPIVIRILIETLRKQDPTLGIKVPEGVEEAIDAVTFAKDFSEVFGEIARPGGGILFKGETRDFYDKYVKK